MNILRRGMPFVAVLLSAVAAASAAAVPAVVPAAAVPAAGLDARVDVSVRRAPLSMFLDTLSEQAKVNFILTEDLDRKQVTAFLHGVTVAEALDVLRDMDGVDYRRIGETSTYVVAPKGSPALRAPVVIDGGPELDRRVNVALKNAPLDTFLSTLAEQTKVNFALGEGLGDRKITAFLTNVTAREALEIVLTLKGLDCRRVSAGTYLTERAAASP